MDVAFKKRKKAKIANDFSQLQKHYGKEATKISRRLQNLLAADNLAAYEELDPLGRLHQLSGDRDEQFAVDVSPNYRLIFEVANDPIPRLVNDEKAIDRASVTMITVIELCEDYHG